MWAILLTFHDAVDEETLIAWEDELGAPVSGIPGVGFTVTTHVDGPDPLKAATVAVHDVTPVVQRQPVQLEIFTEDIYEARADEPTVPELVSAAEAADILNVSRQRVHQLHDSHDQFPAPLYELRTGALWTRDAIEWFDSIWKRQPGRPKTMAV